MDCYHAAEQKKEDYKAQHTEYCFICKSSYVAFTDDIITCHLNSIKHKKTKQHKKVEKMYHYYLLKNNTKYAVKQLMTMVHVV